MVMREWQKGKMKDERWLTCAEHDFDAFANDLSGVRSLNVVLAVDILCTLLYESD